MTAISDRLFRPLVAALILFVTASAAAFGLDDVAARASSLAARPYKAAAANMPTQLRELDYDAYRDIRYRPEKALWRAEKLPFELMFFHQGRAVPESVRINVIEPSGERAVAFDPALFDYGKNKFEPQTLSGIGFNGFRSTTRSTSRATRTRSSCSRARATSAPSARASRTGCRRAAWPVDTAASTGEEFPRFVEFWIERPRASATSLTIYAVARLASRRRRLPLRADAGGRDDDAGDGAPLPARGDRQARPGAADEHVHLRREPAGPRRLPARGATTRTAFRSSSATASGSGGRSSIRAVCSSPRSVPPTRAASA
jgi:hypothetical protein